MLTNPSHLEAVNPLVYGSTRAIQEVKNDKNKVLGVIIHGDAAMSGQGVVW
jgi:2-oxoglutarate dehydrogenase E1 component